MPKKCRVCGAPLNTSKCDYCRTEHSNPSETQASQMDSFQNTQQDFFAEPQNNHPQYQPNYYTPPVKDKLTINIVAGIFAIISAIVVIFYNIALWGTAIADVTGGIVTEGDYLMIGLWLILLIVFAIISLVLHIVGLVQSKKNGIAISGHVLGIVASAVIFVTLTFLSIISVVLYALAAIFTIIQKKVQQSPYQQQRY